jgi:hypothetical protein
LPLLLAATAPVLLPNHSPFKLSYHIHAHHHHHHHHDPLQALHHHPLYPYCSGATVLNKLLIKLLQCQWQCRAEVLPQRQWLMQSFKPGRLYIMVFWLTHRIWTETTVNFASK